MRQPQDDAFRDALREARGLYMRGRLGEAYSLLMTLRANCPEREETLVLLDKVRRRRQSIDAWRARGRLRQDRLRRSRAGWTLLQALLLILTAGPSLYFLRLGQHKGFGSPVEMVGRIGTGQSCPLYFPLLLFGGMFVGMAGYSVADWRRNRRGPRNLPPPTVWDGQRHIPDG